VFHELFHDLFHELFHGPISTAHGALRCLSELIRRHWAAQIFRIGDAAVSARVMRSP
jgi:hypothetical protein